MCACRCGIKVHLKDGKVRYIEGNPDHPVNKGVLCGKGSAGIMTHYSPARLTRAAEARRRARVGRVRGDLLGRGDGDSPRAGCATCARRIRASSPSSPAATRSQSLTGFWAAQFGTPNFAAHGGFCSVNMAAGGLYTIGGSFWEFGEPDWEHTKYLLMFGVAEDHDSNPIKIGLAGAEGARGEVRLGEPGAHGLFRGRRRMGRHPPGHGRPVRDGADPRAAAHRPASISTSSCRYTNAPWLVVRNPGGADDGLFARDDERQAAGLGPRARRDRRLATPTLSRRAGGRAARCPMAAAPCRSST